MKRVKCEECGGKIINKKVDYKIYGINVGNFPAEVCSKCGEICFSEEVSKKITKKTKEMGLWGLESKTKIGVAGTTLDIRLNKKLIDFLKLEKGEEVLVYPESKNKFVVETSNFKE